MLELQVLAVLQSGGLVESDNVFISDFSVYRQILTLPSLGTRTMFRPPAARKTKSGLP